VDALMGIVSTSKTPWVLLGAPNNLSEVTKMPLKTLLHALSCFRAYAVVSLLFFTLCLRLLASSSLVSFVPPQLATFVVSIEDVSIALCCFRR